MKVTEVKVKLTQEHTVKAYVNIVLDDCFIIKGLKIIQAKNLFIAMPSDKRGETFRDIAYPINSEMRYIIEEAVFNAYGQEMDRVRNEYSAYHKNRA